MNDVLAALGPVADALSALGIRYQVGGSVASSVHGVPRSTLDVDIACELPLGQVPAFVAQLSATYYVDADMVSDAVRRLASFNLIHLDTMLKIDVFVRKTREFERMSFERTIRRPLDAAPGAREFDVVSAEDVILYKLEWYRTGGSISQRQLDDVAGVIAVQRGSLDLTYLRHWAAELGVADLLEGLLSG
jgi:hypothetical protein